MYISPVFQMLKVLPYLYFATLRKHKGKEKRKHRETPTDFEGKGREARAARATGEPENKRILGRVSLGLNEVVEQLHIIDCIHPYVPAVSIDIHTLNYPKQSREKVR